MVFRQLKTVDVTLATRALDLSHALSLVPATGMVSLLPLHPPGPQWVAATMPVSYWRPRSSSDRNKDAGNRKLKEELHQ